MRKIIVASEASNLKTSLIDFACYLAKLTHSSLSGVFLSIEREKKINEGLRAAVPAGDSAEEGIEVYQSEKYSTISTQFNEICSNRGVNVDCYNDGEISAEGIIAETRFADLVVVDASLSLEERTEGIPTGFLREFLTQSECPVIVAPESFEWINEIVFAYDGGKSSVHAIKQFTYLFPELRDRKVTVIQVCEGEDHAISEMAKISAWLSNYYNDVNFLVLQGRPKDELFGYLLEKEKMFVVMGAFGRSMISSLFSKSRAELLLKTLNLPIFISHH